MRYPVMTQCLKLIRQTTPEAVGQVVDVGVQTRTAFLMEVLGDVHHHLFEPAAVYHDKLRANYTAAGIDHTLHGVALGDTDEMRYLHKTSMDGSGRVTHSQIRARRQDDMPGLVEIEPIQTRRLDSVFADPLPDLGYVVKLDVDGVEEQVIAGGPETLARASFVIIECSMGRQDMCSRAALLEKLGFRIFDLCDHAYYYGQLALVDMVMINTRLRAADIRYRPWAYSDGKVHWKKWQHGFKDLADTPIDDPFA